MSVREQMIDIIGVPYDLGASCKGGRMGPDALRCAGLVTSLRELGCDVLDRGDVKLPAAGEPYGWSRTGEESASGSPKARHLPEIVSLNKRLFRAVSGSHQNQRIPLVLGGDHSLAIGSVAGTASQLEGPLGVIWFDAHGDLNTFKTTPSGNIHGMSLAASLGYGHPILTKLGGLRPKVRPQHVALIGARSLDPGELQLIQQTGIRVFTIREIDRIGMQEVMQQALAISTRDTAGLHLSFDLDALDPADAPGVGTPVAHGVRLDEAMLAMKSIYENGRLRSADFVELNPVLDLRNRTGKAGVELICTLFGK